MRTFVTIFSVFNWGISLNTQNCTAATAAEITLHLKRLTKNPGPFKSDGRSIMP